MKKIKMMVMLAMLCALPASAQIDSNGVAHEGDAEKTTFKDKVSDAWTNTKEAVNTTADKVRKKLGYDDEKQARTRVKYMPIYTKHKFTDSASDEMVEMCKEKFYQRYPEANILSAVIPSEKWQSEPVYKNGDIVGYLETVYCYILARDGRDGYLNAEYTFQRHKTVGCPYEKVAAKWPEFTRVDNFNSEVYQQIK